MIRTLRLLLAPVLLVSLHATLQAQSPESPAPAEQVRAELRLYFRSSSRTVITTDLEKHLSKQKNEPTEQEYYLSKGKDFVPIKCSLQDYSTPIPYLGPRKLQLFRKAESSDNSQAPFVPACETLLPPTGGKFILFLEGNPKSPRMVAFPRDATAVPKGKMFLFNSTNVELGVVVGKVRNSLKPGASFLFDVSSFTDYQMPFEVHEKAATEWKPLIKTRNVVYFDQQNLAVLSQEPTSNTISFAYLPQVFETDENTTAAQPR